MKLMILMTALLLGTPTAWATEPVAPRPSARTIADACAGCHGTRGRAIAPTPSLAGKPVDEFVQMMRGFKSGERQSEIMNRIAKGYADEDFQALGQFFNQQ